METRPDAILLKFPGTNCDRETARALDEAGFNQRVVPWADFRRGTLERADLVVLPGGFSYGDYVTAGRLARIELEHRLGDTLHRYRDDGGLILGICNGFQILLELGLLPRGSLVENRSGRFVCRWVQLDVGRRNPIYLRYLPDTFELPIAHGEGRFVTEPDRHTQLIERGHVALTYRDNPNGSMADIAALQDRSGRVLGMMPHPERYLYREDHPEAGRDRDPDRGWGYRLFRSIHDHLTEGRVSSGGSPNKKTKGTEWETPPRSRKEGSFPT